jgi:hypothetical protein
MVPSSDNSYFLKSLHNVDVDCVMEVIDKDAGHKLTPMFKDKTVEWIKLHFA